MGSPYLDQFGRSILCSFKIQVIPIYPKGPFKNDVTGEEGGGSDRLVTNGDKGGREVLASDDITIKNFLFKYFYLHPFKTHFSIV